MRGAHRRGRRRPARRLGAGRCRSRRAWLLAGLLVAGLAGISEITTISVLPPSVHRKPTGFAVASSEIALQSPSSPGAKASVSLLYPLPQQAAVLAEEMTSPELLSRIAAAARIPASQLAIDGPVASNLQRTAQEPTEQKRSVQLLAERDPYRITLGTDADLAGVTVQARAPSQPAARGLVGVALLTASKYLAGVESGARTPPAARARVAELQPIVITGGSGGHSLAVLAFALVYVLWCGVVLCGEKLARDIRRLRSPMAAQVPWTTGRWSFDVLYDPRSTSDHREP